MLVEDKHFLAILDGLRSNDKKIFTNGQKLGVAQYPLFRVRKSGDNSVPMHHSMQRTEEVLELKRKVVMFNMSWVSRPFPSPVSQSTKHKSIKQSQYMANIPVQ